MKTPGRSLDPNRSFLIRGSRKQESSERKCYPFAAIVGQTDMKLALVLNVIDPSIGGVLMMGHRGTGKSTAVRALADLLPEISVTRGCPYQCDPADRAQLCAECADISAAGKKLPRQHSAVPVVDLPLGATEDRVCGSIDIERALKAGIRAFEPGLLAKANRGFLYIDEVNLLEDHLVDLLLDVAGTGRNRVERENISIEHPARFVLIGSGNPEEGELRPQLLDRFGLFVEVKTENDPEQRVAIVEKRDAFERNPEKFCGAVEDDQRQMRKRIIRARKNFMHLKVERKLLRQIAGLCSELRIDGHRGELTIMRAARALAAFEGRNTVNEEDVRRVAIMSLRHRLRREALEETGSSVRIEQALEKLFSKPLSARQATRDDDGDKWPDRQGGDGDGRKKTGGNRSLAQQAETSPQGQNGSHSEAELPAPPPLDAELPEFALNHHPKGGRSQKPGSRRRKIDGSVSYNAQRGRYARAVSFRSAGRKIALDATLRALLSLEYRFDRSPTTNLQSPRRISSDALRFKQFARKNGTLFIFAIDTSGSMALNRIDQAKDALLRLLRQSYINRDSVAIIGFCGTAAEVLLPPSRSMLRARRVLDSLTIGGGTPLSAALACAVELGRRASTRSNSSIALLIFTDGHANVPLRANGITERATRRRLIEDEVKRLGCEIRKARIDPVVINTQNAFTPNGEALALAEHLGARYVLMTASETART
jgi:magnesium chelatase subunit D